MGSDEVGPEAKIFAALIFSAIFFYLGIPILLAEFGALAEGTISCYECPLGDYSGLFIGLLYAVIGIGIWLWLYTDLKATGFKFGRAVDFAGKGTEESRAVTDVSKEKTPESRVVTGVFKGIGAIALLFIGMCVAITFIVAPELFGIGYVQVENFRVWVPPGWDCETHTSDGLLVDCMGPELDFGRPSFNILRVYYEGSFGDEVDMQVQDVLARGDTEKRSMLTRGEVDGRPEKTAHYKTYLTDRDLYAYSNQVFIDESQGRMLVVTFSTDASLAFDTDFYKSMSLFDFLD